MVCRKLLLLLLIVGLPLSARAQVSSQGLLSNEGARRVGLTRMWFTQLELDRGKGKMSGLIQQVSTTKAHTIFEVIHEGRSYVFSQRELDAFGRPLGVEGAKEMANRKVAEITALLNPPKDEDAPAEGGAPKPAAKPVTAAKLPKAVMHVIPEITYYATSERGLIHAIDGETGKTKWATIVGKPNYPTTTAGASDDVVAVMNGSTLYAIDTTTGKIAWQRVIAGAPSGSPAVSDELVFVQAMSGNMESFWADGSTAPGKVFRSFGNPTTQPVILNMSIAWATDRGHVYVGNATDGSMKYRIECKDSCMSAPTWLPPDRILATSLDGYVYCVRERSGGIEWRFSAGEPIAHSPIGIGDTVYAITQTGGLYAIHVENGTEKWMSHGVRGFIAGNEDRLYCTDITGNIIVVDAKSGSRVATIEARALEIRMMNTETDRLVVATPSGLIQCFRELNKKWPEARFARDINAPKPDKKNGGKAGVNPAEAAEPKPMAPAGDDPFDTPAGADPMPMDEEMKPKDDKPAADPFGGM